MIGEIFIQSTERPRFIEVIQHVNKRKERIRVLSFNEENSSVRVEYEKLNDVFLLGRAYEPYKMAQKMGSSTISFDNGHLVKLNL